MEVAVRMAVDTVCMEEGIDIKSLLIETGM